MSTTPNTKAPQNNVKADFEEKNKDSSVKRSRAKTENTAAISPEPTRGEIAQRAYELYEGRGSGHGRHQEDWIQAERELREANGES